MDRQLREYYEERLTMCSSRGWYQLMEDIETMTKSTNTLDGVTTDNVDFKKGEVSIMRWMLALKEVSEEAFQQLKDEEQ